MVTDRYSSVKDSNNVRAVDVTSSGSPDCPVHCSVPVLEPVQQGNWVTVRRVKTLLFRSNQNIKQVLPTQ